MTTAGDRPLAQGNLVRKPQRWDAAFGRERIHADWVNLILSSQILGEIDPADFPEDLSLADIITNDCAIRWYSRGDIVYAAGSYETSIFVVLNGGVRVSDDAGAEYAAGQTALPWLSPLLKGKFGRGETKVTRLPTVGLGRYEMFGEVEALTRTPRSNTAIADADKTALLEITWPGARELLHWSDAFRYRVEELYRARSVEVGLKESGLFAGVDAETLAAIARECSFQRHGSFDWSHLYQRESAGRQQGEQLIGQEPLIIEQGHYLEDMFLIRAGFARVTETAHENEFSVGFLESGDVFGLNEIEEGLLFGSHPQAGRGLRSVGYTDLIRIPEHIVGRFILSGSKRGVKGIASAPGRVSHADLSLLDFVVDNRFINATNAMVIDTTRCVGCDDCVRACAAAHDGIPRFVRTGRTHANLMVTSACMHCTDPVCLIDCPTGAIHRDAFSGSVVIDDDTCIGCATCSSACPYNNIQMREVRGPDGAILVDEDGSTHLKATKCDLCAGHSGGPACQRACPHDALTRIDIRDMDSLSDRQSRV
ncbi:MAG: 4Fe-4S dicluster domain-containing protein [Anderseniella sp.]